MKLIINYLILFTLIMTVSCKEQPKTDEASEFQFLVEQFADLRIMRYPVEGFDQLELKQKELIYYLSQAAIEGRDILFDQNYRHNLTIRRTLEAIYESDNTNREAPEFNAFEVYLKRVWFSSGIHHHYSTDKIDPGFSSEYFVSLIEPVSESKLPLLPGETKEQLIQRLIPIIFDRDVDAKRVNQTEGTDLLLTSANNYWGEGVTQAEAEAFYDSISNSNDPEPISYGLNSRLEKEEGRLVEKVWKVGGIYSPAIEKIVFWLAKALDVAENEKQKEVIDLLIQYYQTGDLKTFDQYCIAWLKDQESLVDFVNGFTETYGDPLGMKASWESLVNFKNLEATKRTEIISRNAQWFEDHSPVDSRFKKPEVKGVSAKVITAAMLGGDCYPATPIGINLPNADWIRKEYGSKSVTIENITYSYSKVKENDGFLEEFAYSQEEIERSQKYGFLADNLHTDLHECLGHGSGQLLPGVSGRELKAYDAAIEEARADLFALYYLGDRKTVKLGLLPDREAYKAEYDSYIRNGMMTQLTRIVLDNQIEQAHMRNRALISRWAFEKGRADKVIERLVREGKTYFVINDYKKLRVLFGELLSEIQRIKSEGDFDAARDLVENYGVKIERELHEEVLDRFAKLNIAPYSGFVNPVYLVERDSEGNITDIKLDYSEGYTEQMLRYSREYSYLPDYN